MIVFAGINTSSCYNTLWCADLTNYLPDLVSPWGYTIDCYDPANSWHASGVWVFHVVCLCVAEIAGIAVVALLAYRHYSYYTRNAALEKTCDTRSLIESDMQEPRQSPSRHGGVSKAGYMVHLANRRPTPSNQI
jgi:hypothetical protein